PPHGLGAEDAGDGVGDLPPPAGLPREVLPARAGELVVAGLAVVVGGAPRGHDPAAGLEALEGGVEGAVLDEEDVVGGLLDRARDPLAVLGPEHQGAEDEQVERALDEGQPLGVVSGRHLTGRYAGSGQLSTRETPPPLRARSARAARSTGTR